LGIIFNIFTANTQQWNSGAKKIKGIFKIKAAIIKAKD